MDKAECEALFNYITKKNIQQNILKTRNVVYERNLFHSVSVVGTCFTLAPKIGELELNFYVADTLLRLF